MARQRTSLRPRALSSKGNLRNGVRRGYYLKFIKGNLKPVNHMGKLVKQLISPAADKPGPPGGR